MHSFRPALVAVLLKRMIRKSNITVWMVVVLHILC